MDPQARTNGHITKKIPPLVCLHGIEKLSPDFCAEELNDKIKFSPAELCGLWSVSPTGNGAPATHTRMHGECACYHLSFRSIISPKRKLFSNLSTANVRGTFRSL